jgi:hypothetical protein
VPRSSPLLKDGKRCAKTIVDLFKNAKEPDNIVVGLIEQNKEDDESCLEAYCSEFGEYCARRDPTTVILYVLI